MLPLCPNHTPAIERRGEPVNTLFAIGILADSESHDDVLDEIQNYFDGAARPPASHYPVRIDGRGIGAVGVGGV